MSTLSTGMATMSAKAGMLITFACLPGTTAADNGPNGRNGMFTYHLLQHITRPGEDITMLLRDVTNGVVNDTRGKQMPYVTSALLQQHIYLVPYQKNTTLPAEELGTSSKPTVIRKRLVDIDEHDNWNIQNGTYVM
ncbi:unnamed protein product [Rotaria sp. Silwood1]|nr:unnamed protein product [Rotaria sp. Silwood1]CAF3449230.1 unnamed protein product [Rotaria sp. Silwood1]CAF3477933.1 unnamed protein product [Rotaria sp. Silwood1]CAF4560404.1 unnamed protein product [Rotaria sp. Silwood1]CAF4645353.1 unnamed protein product [Rotaria sp. Silwood1]